MIPEKNNRTGRLLRFTDIRSFVSTTFRTGMLWLSLPGFVAWVAVSCGIALAETIQIPAVRTLLASADSATLTAGALLLLLPGILTRMNTVRFLAFFSATLLIVNAGVSRERAAFSTLGDICKEGKPLSISGKVLSPPLPRFEGFHFLLRVDSVSGDTDKMLKGIILNSTLPYEPPQYGAITLTGRYSFPRAATNPFGYDEYRSMMAKGVWGTFEAESFTLIGQRLSVLEKLSLTFRRNANATIRKISDYDLRALLQACFLGDKEFLSPELKERFRIAGTYHLIAISGLHTAILTGALYFLLRLFPLGRLAPHLICIGALWLYLLFIGMIPSLFRATVMATLVIVSLLFERKNYPMHTIGLAGTAWLLLSPESLGNPGYQLSFAATAALLTLFPVAFRYCPHAQNRLADKLLVFLFSSVSISLVSFLATAPILLYHFGTLSFFGIIANLVAVTAMTAGMWAFFAGLLIEMVLPFLTFIPLWISERFLDIVVNLGNLASRFDWSQASFSAPAPETIVAFALLLIGCAAVRSERLGKFLLISTIVTAVLVPVDLVFRRCTDSVQVVRFDLPRSPMAGIRWPDNSVWLFSPLPARCTPYDFERAVLPWLRHAGNGRVNAVMVPDGQEASLPHIKSLSSARILTIPGLERHSAGKRRIHQEFSTPDTLLASWMPYPACTCSAIFRSGIPGLRVAAVGADTVILLPTASFRAGKKHRGGCTVPGTMPEAVVLSFRNGTVNASTIVPSTHPLNLMLAEE